MGARDLTGTLSHPCLDNRLEEFGEARAGLVARVKIAEKEREALEADKLAAEAYLDKEREARSHQRVLAHTFEHMAKVRVWKRRERERGIKGRGILGGPNRVHGAQPEHEQASAAALAAPQTTPTFSTPQH